MAVYKDNIPTKDGKIWFFKTQYEDFDGTKKPKKSGRFATKKEAEQAELEFKISLHEKVNHNEITFEEMIELFLNFKKKRVRETTYYNYGNKIPYLKPLFKIKLKDFNYLILRDGMIIWIMKQHLLQELKMIFISFLNLYLIMLLHGMNLVLLKCILK